jgi:hypothetical protein
MAKATKKTSRGRSQDRSVGDGCAGPRKPSIRLFHASQASLSASFLAADARRSDKRTALPYIRLRDFVLMADHNASHHTSSASR